MKKNKIKELITLLGFNSQEGEQEVYYKNYSKHKNYTIKVNFEKEVIEYGTLICLGDETTSNFVNSENFVVLECIDRILEKGYPPYKITLEHKWPMGRKEKGKLDILIADKDDRAYLMIECKTWGEEYEKEKKKMQRDGGQLFSYFQQDKSAQYLCLYSSRLEKGKIEFVNDIIKVNDLWRELNNQKEIHDHWNKNFKDNGIFEDWACAYNIEIKALTRGRLKELSEEDSGRIFNQFAEILRHNVVSDKPNAFNKILNLFICKIIDEDKNENEEVAFQWLENDSNESLQIRLNDLYKEGMKRFLDIEVTDYNDRQLEDKLYNINEPEIKKQIQEMFQHIRLQKNPEFAFKEVYNEKSFSDNAIVVKEVVELLQAYQFRYGHKQQFLGDFFELLLSTSIKQEAGQFFTPVPIAKFIISCFPIKEFIIKRINNGCSDILPFSIDYATGSGHFLTELMDEIQSIIDNFETKGLRPTASRRINSWKQGQFEWAKEYIYGIEADYRLVKTTKVSSFLNGDGEAIVIRADGLDNFQKSLDYRGKLKEVSQDNPKDNGHFDLLVANPPYSVSAFKNTLKNGEESFELFNRLTDDSSEIECLFIERTKQLLRPGGWAGIILPSSILSNSGIYTDTREIILKYFEIKAIVEFGSNTFMATGTNTVALFLVRRNNTDYKKIEQAIKIFFENTKDSTVNGIENVFGKYVNEVFDNITLADYVTLIRKAPNDKIKSQELFVDYKTWFEGLSEIKQLKEKKVFKDKPLTEQKAEIEKLFYEKVLLREQDKMLYFILVYPLKCLLIKVGEKQAEKDFIGYEFSSRRGHEGIKMYRDENGKATTKLFDDEGSLNQEKVNSYIYNALLNKNFIISTKLKDNVFYNSLVDMMNYKSFNFGKEISLSQKKKDKIDSKYQLVKLGEIVTLISGQSPSSKYYNDKGEGLPFYQGKTEFGEDFLNDPVIWTKETTKESVKNDILMSVRAPVGPVNINLHEKICIGRGLCALRPSEVVLAYYLFFFLKYNQHLISGNNGAIFSSISRHQIEGIKVPLPPKSIQKNIVNEVKIIEKREKELKERLLNQYNIIEDILASFSSVKPILEICTIASNKMEPKVKPNELLNYIGLENIVSHQGRIINFKPTLGSNIKSTKNVFQKGDVLYGKLRPYLNKVWVAEFDGICSTDILVLKSNYPILLKYILMGKNFVASSSSLMKGTNLPRLQVKDFMEFKVPFPNIAEYKGILTKLNHIESIITKTETDIECIKEEKELLLKKYLN